MTEIPHKDISALIDLLDDPDDAIFSTVKNKLLDLGERVIPMLESAWENSFNSLLQGRIENIIHRIQFEKVIDALVLWKNKRNNSLWEVVVLIARYQYPDLDESKLLKQLQAMQHDVWLELNENLTALEKVKVLNHILFSVHHYSGNTENYHAPENSYLNKVMESKKGNPLTLSVIYLLLANMLKLPIKGVNLPDHFVLAYLDEYTDNKDIHESKILFYINPFSKGAVFGKKEIDVFLKQLNIATKKSFYIPCTNADIVQRLLRNLSAAYTRSGNTEKVKEVEEMMKAIES